MNRIKSEEQTSLPDSETSVDYYVTTVNDQTPTKTGSDISNINPEDATNAPVVVSVYRAGSVKVRIRKKSKRRKKKSNLALEENGFHVSDDGVLFHSSGSDESHKKMPRRSSSLSEKDLLYKNSVDIFSAGFPQQNDNISSIAGESQVRRRIKKKPSFTNTNTRRRGVILDDISINQPAKAETKRSNIKSQSSKSPRRLPESRKQWSSVDSPVPAINKRNNRLDALATIDAYVMEVEEATTVAKLQEGERRKDPVLRKSRSLDELVESCEGANVLEGSDYLALLEQVKPPLVSFICNHQKSTSFDEQRAISGNVFTSDRNNSVDSYQHKLLAKSSSAESRAHKFSSTFSPNALLDGTPAEFVNGNLPTRANSDKRTSRGFSQSSLNKGKDFDYGLSHLEQVCKLFEQIGELRQKNQLLEKRVEELETELNTLKQEKGSFSTEISLAELHKTNNATKRPHVGRIKDAWSRTNRKTGTDKAQENRTISQPMLIGGVNDVPERNSIISDSTPADAHPNDRRVIYTNLSGRRRKRPNYYSRDDLDIFSKNKWKFWKGTAGRNTDQPAKNQVLSTIKAENTKGTAIHLKSASVTLDSLLSGVDDDFSRKLQEWESGAKNSRDAKLNSSTDSKAGVGRPMSMIALPMSKDGSLRKQKLNDEKIDNKENSRKKLSLWDRAASQKLSGEKRSNSFDKVSENEDEAVSPSRATHNRSMSASADFHKSLPCVLPPNTGLSHLVHLRRSSGYNSSGSMEWNGLQKAFPTTLPKRKSLTRVGGSGHSRLASPLRKLKNSAKRNSWSHTKFANSVYLPSTDFLLASSLSNANSIADQFTLQLDQNDVKDAVEQEASGGDAKSESSSTLLNTEVSYKKLNESVTDANSEKKQEKFHSSPLARYHAEHGARSFRRSKRVEILRLSSCEVLAAAPVMSPVLEESENLCQSLPNLIKNDITDQFSTDKASENARRFTVTVINLKNYALKKPLEITQSAPSLFLQKPFSNMLKPPIPIQRSSSCKQVPPEDAEFRRRAASKRIWNTSSLQRSRRKTASLSSDSASEPPPFNSPAAEDHEKDRKIEKKWKSKKGKMFNRFRFPIAKGVAKIKVNDDPVELSPDSSGSKKIVGRIFSFRDRSTSSSSKASLSPDGIRARANTLSSPNTVERSKPLAPCELKQKRSSKIAELSQRLAVTGDASESCRQISSPVPIKKGIVNRLSKRFARHDKEKDDKKAFLFSSNSKNTNFLNAKSRFEIRGSTLPKTATSLKQNENSNNNRDSSYQNPCFSAACH